MIREKFLVAHSSKMKKQTLRREKKRSFHIGKTVYVTQEGLDVQILYDTKTSDVYNFLWIILVIMYELFM